MTFLPGRRIQPDNGPKNRWKSAIIESIDEPRTQLLKIVENSVATNKIMGEPD